MPWERLLESPDISGESKAEPRRAFYNLVELKWRLKEAAKRPLDI
jgi:hypothetical protein